ncbi:rhythmically expressed gene 2 protein [Culicoides brevitarsis]|uniref:rhythmically expressed gene 2 protein n=1 Tax=Culicoides brevitarsis TaxID=469753 RepID=UPI00307B557E
MSFLSNNLRRFKLVTFDVTGTLLKFSKPPAVQYLETAETFGIKTLSEDALAKSFRKNFRLMSRKYPNFGCNSSIDWFGWWRMLVMNTINDSSTVELNQNLVNNVAHKLIEQYETAECWTKIDHADEIIEKIRKARKEIGVISNFDPRLSKILKNMKFSGIDFVVTSYEAGRMKPEKEIFDRALFKCYELPMQYQALHIGNEIGLDCKGANEAGWSGVIIRPTEGMKEKESWIQCPIYNSLGEFLEALETKNIAL